MIESYLGRGRRLAEGLRAAQGALIAAEIAKVSIVAQLADWHRVDEAAAERGVERVIAGGADGTTGVGEFLALELGPLLGISPTSAALLIADTLNLRDRHPELWQAVLDGTVRTWQAQAITRRAAAAGISGLAAQWLDAQVTPFVDRLPWGRLLRFLDGMIAEADPERAAERTAKQRSDREVRLIHHQEATTTVLARVDLADGVSLDGTLARIASILAEHGDAESLDVRRAKALGIVADPARALALLDPDGDHSARRGGSLLPTSQLIVHIAAESLASEYGVARVIAGQDQCAINVTQLAAILRDTRVVVRPVIDLNDAPAVDSYEIPRLLRQAVIARNPYDVFPFSTRLSTGCDLDHTVPFRDDRSHVPRTRLGNLAPLSRRPHRAKTHAGWRVRQPRSGVFEWTSPLGYAYVVDALGTRRALPPPQQTPSPPPPPRRRGFGHRLARSRALSGSGSSRTRWPTPSTPRPGHPDLLGGPLDLARGRLERPRGPGVLVGAHDRCGRPPSSTGS
ncbi:MAG: hypothetical protein IPL43_07655 [Micropruina sp.]|nr:hypothetical protein [Micropruina sp.]